MKKFYQNVAVTDVEGGYSIMLDGRSVKTPGKALLMVPTKALADVVADEWRAQEDDILPETMPMTQYANTAIDRIGSHRDTIVDELVAYGHTDLLCYRADDPDELIALQSAKWQSLLDKLDAELAVRLNVTVGIVPMEQSSETMEHLNKLVQAHSDYELAAFHSFVSGFGSIALALSLTHGLADFEACWQASILEQTFQEEAWGTDVEVEDKRKFLKAEMQTTFELWRLLHS